MNPAGQGNLSKPIEEAPTLDAGSSLRDALNLLLSKGTHTLSIIDSQRRTIGTVDLEGIQRVTRGHERSIEK